MFDINECSQDEIFDLTAFGDESVGEHSSTSIRVCANAVPDIVKTLTMLLLPHQVLDAPF